MAFGLHHLLCYLSPNPPLTFGLPPSHLGKVYKHPLLSVWRRFCKGDLSLRSNRGYGGNGDYMEVFTISPITPIIPKLFLAQSKLLS
jgi:hypothetical protein